MVAILKPPAKTGCFPGEVHSGFPQVQIPFCIPWDVWNCYKVFEGSAEPFKYHFNSIQLSGFVTGGETITVIPAFDLNFADYQQIDIAIKVFKFLELLLFVFMLLKFTRSNFMKG